MSEDIKQLITSSISENKIVLFMKGTPEMPMCGFSSQVVQILNSFKIEYKTFDATSSISILNQFWVPKWHAKIYQFFKRL